MPQAPGHSHERSYRLKPIGGGLNDARNPTLLADGETPDCRDIEFNHDSVESSGGAVKFGNQPAPKAGVRTKASRALPPLKYAADISVPSRGYAYFPYHRDHDLGGDFQLFDSPVSFTADTFHGRRGRSFEFTAAFEIEKDEPIYGTRNGLNSGPEILGAADANVVEFLGLGSTYDEGFEEFVCILQKGGDRLAPMSWALGVVNVGGPSTWDAITGEANLEAPSTLALCFMWLDAPQWGHTVPGQMRYYVGTGGQHGIAPDERYSTHTHRAIVTKAFIEPGRSYQVAVSLGLDTGGISGATTNAPTAVWIQNGTFSITVADDLGNVTTYATEGTQLFAWKGPSDSLEYLKRYGVRYSGRDAMFGGLGMRFAPWNKTGFIPLGLDSAAMEAGGHRMMDTTNGDAGSALGYGTLTCLHTAGASRLEVSARGLQMGVGGENPLDAAGSNQWPGLFDGTVVGNPDALRNYWAVPWKHATWAGIGALRGCRIRLNTYEEVGGPIYRFTTDLAASTLAWNTVEFFIQGFRWNQRPIRLSTVRIFSSPRNYADRRVRFSLRSETLLDDLTDESSPSMLACWPMDDAGGGVLRETVAARDGFLAPFTLAQPSTGGVFLSGEGERLALDFGEDTALQLALDALGKTRKGSVAIELELVLTEGYYALDSAVAYRGTTYRIGKHAPVIASWAIRDPDSGVAAMGPPLLEFGHRCRLPNAVGSEPFYYPMGFSLAGAVDWDQVDAGLLELVHPWNTGAPLTNNWDSTAAWVGQVIRVQIGLHSTGVADEFRAYIAATPKQALFPQAGDPGDAEMVYWTVQNIRRRDLARSVITIGGRWEPFGSDDPGGYPDMACRMVLRQARVFAAPAPGVISQSPLFLAVTAEGQRGSINYDRDGKLVGGGCLPAGPLSPEDILRPLGPGSVTVNAAQQDATVSSASGLGFSTEVAESSLDAIERTLLIVSDDGSERREEHTQPEIRQDFYLIESVAAGGGSLELARPFDDETRRNAWARSFRLVGYSLFDDDLFEKPLAVTAGTPYIPGTSTSADNVLVERQFENGAPPSAGWDLCILTAVADPGGLAPSWWRSANLPRKNPILGLRDFGDTAYAATRGCVYEADDRWRKEGPTDTIRASLALRNEMLGGVSFPLEGDVVRFDSADSLMIRTSLLLDTTIVVDAWLWLDEIGGYQTWLWIANESSDPSQAMGVHELSWGARLADGYPELVVGSTATYNGTNKPEKGLYIARAQARVRPRTWTHVRWRFWSLATNTWVSLPECYVNGRKIRSSTNANENGAGAGQWVTIASVPLFTGQGSVLVGAARDSLVDLAPTLTMDLDALGGVLTPPDRRHGLMHSLGGMIAALVIDGPAGSAGGTNFNPHSISYSATRKFAVLQAPEGVGHKLFDGPGARYGLIRGHPFISLNHEMGRGDQLASWAEHGSRLVVTTGGRPLYVQG